MFKKMSKTRNCSWIVKASCANVHGSCSSIAGRIGDQQSLHTYIFWFSFFSFFFEYKAQKEIAYQKEDQVHDRVDDQLELSQSTTNQLVHKRTAPMQAQSSTCLPCDACCLENKSILAIGWFSALRRAFEQQQRERAGRAARNKEAQEQWGVVLRRQRASVWLSKMHCVNSI